MNTSEEMRRVKWGELIEYADSAVNSTSGIVFQCFSMGFFFFFGIQGSGGRYHKSKTKQKTFRFRYTHFGFKMYTMKSACFYTLFGVFLVQ